MARFGQCLAGVLANKAWDVLDGLIEARQAVRDHDQSAREGRRLERVDMAVRLVRWLGERSQQAGVEPKSLAVAADEHLRDGGFVDWARLSLRSGDPVQVLSEAYARLFEAVTQIRETQAHGFARLLVDWTAAGSQADESGARGAGPGTDRRSLCRRQPGAGDRHRRHERRGLPGTAGRPDAARVGGPV